MQGQTKKKPLDNKNTKTKKLIYTHKMIKQYISLIFAVHNFFYKAQKTWKCTTISWAKLGTIHVHLKDEHEGQLHWVCYPPNTLSSVSLLITNHTPAGNRHTSTCRSKKNDVHVVGWCSLTLAMIGMCILAYLSGSKHNNIIQCRYTCKSNSLEIN